MKSSPALWTIHHDGFQPGDIEKHGSKFIIGNGAMGVRGTLEEFDKIQLAACTLAGLYDQVGDKWREPVNAPHTFNARITIDDTPLSVLTTPIARHNQTLDLRCAIHSRETIFRLPDGAEATLRADRFLSLADTRLGVMTLSLTVTRPCRIRLETGIDGNVWDLNGPHLTHFETQHENGIHLLSARTGEKSIPLAVAEALHTETLPPSETHQSAQTIQHRFDFNAAAAKTYSFKKYTSVATGLEHNNDAPATAAAALATARAAAATGRDALLAASRAIWDARWRDSDVLIEGDNDSQLALRYSIYQLLIIAPASDACSIPARGLSGQVYKGGIFWDTEIFMSPFFDHTQPALGRRLMRYRVKILDGARRKAAGHDCRGAFYAWESQETGDDACTLFNFTDVFTGRPMRTHFRDKQVHISADVAFAIWRHYRLTGDETLLTDGGAEVILECARFFLSYAWFKPEKNRYEILDVVGPDEYHERVANNAFTTAMASATLRIALDTLALLEKKHPATCAVLLERLDYADDLKRIREMDTLLFRPAPDPKTGVIEQFTGYHKLEDTTPAEVKKRVLNPTEYWGGGHGIATPTQVIKQADVVLMLHLFSENFSDDVKRANWDFYEPRTEHGSSLSPCVYALLAAELGRTDYAFKYFLRTATIDLTGDAKQYSGGIYIGGTHPAANGGAWMTAVLGFGGLRLVKDEPRGNDIMRLTPRLPAKWKKLTFRFTWRGQWFTASITSDAITLTADANNTADAPFVLAGQTPVTCAPGKTITQPC
ncbi:glycoside hydrolase family 65 protein [Opitutaceae bacterium TAV4]|nr:glycoside hydrolase family 65 protein [Opitutaceae bacterium TAV4]RRJ99952.1 glycoside hydrolase family 65 protein [Opitutaceae bacterium TAV3]